MKRALLVVAVVVVLAAVGAALDSDKDIAEIEQEVNAAKEAGIQGVPCFILDGKYAISGAQEPEALAQAIQQVSAQAAE